MRHTPELRALLGEEGVAALAAAAHKHLAGGADAARAALHVAFGHLMSQSADAVAVQAAALSARLGAAPPSGGGGGGGVGGGLEPDAVARRLLRDFPGDVGVFAPYLLNVRTGRGGVVSGWSATVVVRSAR